MADERFFPAPSPLTLAEIAELTGGELSASASDTFEVSGIASLEQAQPTDISFWADAKHKERFAATQAGACFVKRDADLSTSSTAGVHVDDPQRAYALTAQKLYPEVLSGGISEQAQVDPTASIGKRCNIAAYASIGPHVEIGDDTAIGSGTVIGQGVAIGRNSIIGANVTLSHCLIGDRVRLHSGVRIGQDGFGYAASAEGHLKIPQVGRVIIQNDVEVGSNTCIDRGALDDTVIGEGTKIDNLVQIGHNCRIGRHCIIVSQVGLSGSVELGDFAVLGGAVGVADHVKIGHGSQVAAASGVHRDIPDGEVHGGYPAQPIADWRREFGLLRRMVRQSRKKKES